MAGQKDARRPGWHCRVLSGREFPTHRHSNCIAANCFRRVKLPFSRLLDTNVPERLRARRKAVMAWLRQEAPRQLAVSVITEMEVEYGLARNPDLAPRFAG